MRALTLSTHGKGQRTVRVGYVVAMPLWKASYRMSLPPDPKAQTARLQGWAVLENCSGRAWQDVELTLLSGNPVTFRQALYESYYVPRPTVPVESGSHVLPPHRGQRLAGIQALERDQLLLMLLDERRRSLQDPAAVRRPHAAPDYERRARRAHRQIDVGFAALRDLGNRFFGRRIQIDGIFAAARSDSLAVDEQLVVIKLYFAIH